jgi:hypothetical protein
MAETEFRSAAEDVSDNPKVLQIEMFPLRSDRLNMGPNLIFGMIDGKLGLIAQLEPGSNRSTDFTLESAGIVAKIVVTLIGDAPPYTVEFDEFMPPVEPPKSPESRQKVEFPIGKSTHVRLFDLLEVRGFYGNPQRKRP